ncbi:MAG: hypothetical protein FWG31_04540 [Oscillospiraceae bacterium]|nr:hypothetical protein [Oscillospiraceae bacterium]
MDITRLLPFERNRYYTGKLLSSADFLAEQEYLCGKQRFVNSMMFGSGVACGLGVYSLDDDSIMVESGVAVDGTGREIVLPRSVMLKLSAIDGYEETESDRYSLMLAYAEEQVHPVYSIARGGQSDEEYEMNRVREGWRLFLRAPEKPPVLLTEFLNTAQIYADDDYMVEVSVPAAVSCGATVKLTVTVTKLSAAARNISLDCSLQMPSFTGETGGSELPVRVEETLAEPGESVSRDYWLKAGSHPAPESMIVAKSSFIRVSVGGALKKVEENLVLKSAIADISTERLIEHEVGRVSLESLQMPGVYDAIRLADISVVRSKNAYIIDRVEDLGVKRYIRTMAAEHLRREFASWYRDAALPAAGTEPPPPPREQSVAAREPVYASGTCEIPLGTNSKKGNVVFSSEIMHGLGKGNVFVTVGSDYADTDPRDTDPTRHTIYGNPALFAGEAPPIVLAETSVKVLADRGCFVAAARLLKPTNYSVLVLRWVAVKLPAEDDENRIHKLTGKSISAQSPTVVLGTRESHHFAVSFNNMEPCGLIYNLTEKDSGEITSDGIYTAPSKEGVYEIRISCADMPLVSTYAYAVVKKKGAEEKT